MCRTSCKKIANEPVDIVDFITEYVIIVYGILFFDFFLFQVLLKLLKPLPLVACVHKKMQTPLSPSPVPADLDKSICLLFLPSAIFE